MGIIFTSAHKIDADMTNLSFILSYESKLFGNGGLLGDDQNSLPFSSVWSNW